MTDEYPKTGPYPLCVMLLASALAAAAAGFLLDWTRGRFDSPPPTVLDPTDKQVREYNAKRQAALRWSIALSTGLSAAALGAILGMGAGFARHSLIRGLAGATVAALLAAILAGGGGMVGQYYYAVESTSGGRPTLMRGIIMQATYWLPTAIAVGLGVGATSNGVKVAAKVVMLALVGCIPICLLVTILGTLLDASFKEEIPPSELMHCLLMTGVGTPIIAFLVYFGLLPASTSIRSET